MKTLQEIDTWLAAEAAKPQPLSFATISAAEAEDFYANFRNAPFTAEQKAVLRKYWMVVPNVAAIKSVNEDLPPYTRATPVTTIGGDVVLNIDLMTDFQTYGGAANKLRAFKVKELDPDTAFPVAEEIG